MKHWLRVRRNESSEPAKVVAESEAPTTDFKSASPATIHHAWNTLSSVSAPTGTGPDISQPLNRGSDTTLTTRKSASSAQIMDSIAAEITAVPSKHQQHVLVRSEHYFRLALESWEQLRACHFKASQKLSLAEWLHIHALLLFGRIQSVREPFTSDPVAQHNRIDLSSGVAVFEPLATALNAIGIVHDGEVGITFVPNAMFPSDGQQPLMAYTAHEMQHILDGTMYDWQRSWKRVLEARHLRDTQYTQFALVRSSSELISAIRAKSEAISRIQRVRPSRRESVVLEEYQGELGELSELLEEARNAKDYTMRPPCVRVYDNADSESSIMLLSSGVEAQNGSITGAPLSSRSIHSSADANDELIRESVKKLDQNTSLSALQELSLGGGKSEDRSAAPLKSALRKSSAFHVDSPSEKVAPDAALDGVSLNLGNASDTTLQNGSASPPRLAGSDGSSSSSTGSTVLSTGGSPKKSHRVQLAGAADASNCYVHFDARLWEEYEAFVEALQSTRLTRFGSLKKEPEGDYAWLLPVKLKDSAAVAQQATMSALVMNQRPTLQSTPRLRGKAAGRQQSLQLRLPRTSIPKREQALALLLQTSSASPEVCESWHVETEIELDMHQYVLDYVNTGIFDSRAI